ncbi:hypothetical protein OSCI_1230004 [Kamptonema sp. PCC 6506]|nr:hypothetical protein OSCI_1230004 [Kamptonema sp. PCC 6506]
MMNEFTRMSIFGNFRFITPESSSQRLSRTDLLPEWVDFLIYVCDNNVIKTAPVRPMKSLAKTLRWMKKQVAPTVAYLKRIFGSNFTDYMHDLTMYGLSRHDNFRDAMVEYICYDASE